MSIKCSQFQLWTDKTSAIKSYNYMYTRAMCLNQIFHIQGHNLL